MRRLTIAMSDALFARLLGYSADQSKSKLRRISLGESVRTLVTSRLDDIGYVDVREEVVRPSARHGA